MPRLKGIGMPSKRKRKTAKLQEVPEPDADEVDQGSACGPASPTHSSPPTVDSDEDLMPLERELATAEHDLALARAARWMRMADAKLKECDLLRECDLLHARLSSSLDVLHPDSKQQTTPASPRDALECVAALARTRECRQNCVRFAYRGPQVDRLHVLELKRDVE